MKKARYLILVVALGVGLLIGGCGGQKQQGGATASGADSTAGKKAEFVWRMQVVHNTGHSDFAQNKQTAEDILKATNGRVKIEVHPNGTFVSSLEAFQACGDGVFEMHSSWPVYAKGIEYAFLPLGTGNMTMDAHDKWVWIYEANGWDLMQKALDKLNLKLLGVEIWGTEVMMANQPFNDISEMKGKKMRTSDPRLLAKNGVAGVSMPLEEVFTSITTGAVDAAEFGHLDYNKGLGLTDVTKYAVWPDFWNCHNVTTVVVNKAAWNKLPPDLQMIIEMSFKAREFQHWTKSQYQSAVDMKELQESGKMKFHRMNTADFGKYRQQTYEIEQEDAKKYGGLTAEVLNSQYKFMETWYPYKSISRWWGEGLTPEQQMGFEPKKK